MLLSQRSAAQVSPLPRPLLQLRLRSQARTSSDAVAPWELPQRSEQAFGAFWYRQDTDRIAAFLANANRGPDNPQPPILNAPGCKRCAPWDQARFQHAPAKQPSLPLGDAVSVETFRFRHTGQRNSHTDTRIRHLHKSGVRGASNPACRESAHPAPRRPRQSRAPLLHSPAARQARQAVAREPSELKP